MARTLQKTGATSQQKYTAPDGVVFFSDSTGLFTNIPEEYVAGMIAGGISLAYSANPGFTAASDAKFGNG